MEEMNPLSQAIVAGNLEQTQQLVRQALAEGMDTQTLINDYLTTGMAEIGQRFQDRKAFVPNLLMSARAMKGALEILKPYMTEETETRLGTIVIGTVKGDLHDIGKNLVASMFEGCGIQGRQSGNRRLEREIHPGNPRAPCRHRLPVGTAHHDDELHAQRGRRPGKGGFARPGEGHGRRSSRQ